MLDNLPIKVDPALDVGLDAEAFDPSDTHVRDNEDCADDRIYIDEAWKSFEAYADPHFPKEFRLAGKFQSRAWELRLRYISALGGRLELVAAFGDKRIIITGAQPTRLADAPASPLER